MSSVLTWRRSMDMMQKFGEAFTRALLEEDATKADKVFDLQTRWLVRHEQNS